MTTTAQAFADRYAAAYNAHDADALRSQYTDDSVETNPLGTLTGIDAIVADAIDMWGAYSDARITFTHAFSEDDSLATEWVFTGTNDGPRTVGAVTRPALGIQLELHGSSIMHLRDGRIASMHQYYAIPAAVMTAIADTKA